MASRDIPVKVRSVKAATGRGVTAPQSGLFAGISTGGKRESRYVAAFHEKLFHLDARCARCARDLFRCVSVAFLRVPCRHRGARGQRKASADGGAWLLSGV